MKKTKKNHKIPSGNKKKRKNIIQYLLRSKFWKDSKIGRKYGFALWLTIGVFSISIAISFMMLTFANIRMEDSEEASNRALEIADITTIFHMKGTTIGNYIIDSNPKHLNTYSELEELFLTKEDEVLPLLQSNETKKLLAKIAESDKKLNDLFYETIEPEVRLHRVREYRLGKLQADNIINETVEDLNTLLLTVKEEQQSAVNQASATMKTTLVVLIASLILSAVFGIMCNYYIGRIIARRLNEVVDISNEIAAGNLNAKDISLDNQDEIAELGQATNAMKNKLQSMIKEINGISADVTQKSSELADASSEVASASQQISSTMQELSGGAEEQAGSSSDLSRVMEDYLLKVDGAKTNGESISAMTNDVLQLTISGNSLMKSSQSQMDKINEIMKDSVQRMSGLDTETKEVSKLVGVIQDIANQTNLLALNAAIEAARAGEQGRGFAVVADEVRKLAEQVSYSVNDITNIVTGIQNESSKVALTLQNGYEQVEKGTEQIQMTAQTFEEISNAVDVMTNHVNDITVNLETVANNSVMMNESIENIAAVSEESAAGIEQTSASVTQTNQSIEDISKNVQSLSELAVRLNQMIKAFKI
ncbi:methyl-accepting chemotaxis protein [Cytobacillus horneckiae]|uniref:methyl-accepting chemotaxis protein n=1 Tax=Cytobacillus horneckiae TaxID=549687 RepID=UPI003D9AB11F